MSETPPNQDTPPNGDNQNLPSLVVLAQYLKDLSFENPHAPGSFQDASSPQMEVNVDVQGRPMGSDQYEVALTASAKASRDGQAVFVAEACYAGVF